MSAAAARIERYLEKLVRGVTTEEQALETERRAWRYYHRLRREDRQVMLAMMLRNTLHRYHLAERRRRRRGAGAAAPTIDLTEAVARVSRETGIAPGYPIAQYAAAVAAGMQAASDSA